LRARGTTVAVYREMAEHELRVGDVHLAAVGLDVDARHAPDLPGARRPEQPALRPALPAPTAHARFRPDARWSAAPSPRARGLRIARGEPAPLPALPPGDAGPEAPPPRAARRREARVRLSALRHAVCVQDRAAAARDGLTWVRTRSIRITRRRRGTPCAPSSR